MILIAAVGLYACGSGIKYPEGGYDYPKQVADKDTNFYYYPYKDQLSRKDSFDYAGEYLFWKAFNEPNLSLRPREIEVLRFAYSGWSRKSYIILLSKNNVIIKSGDPASLYEPNEESLTQIEKKHLHLLKIWFPLDEHIDNPGRQHYFDSLILVYPRLRDPAYYQSLADKSYILRPEKFHYDSVNIHLPEEKFDSIVNLINASEFWTLPFRVICPDSPTDGDGFSLEISTGKKYKIVHVSGCPSDSLKFTKACQKLVSLAHLDNTIHLWNTWQVDTLPRAALVVKDVHLEEIKEPKHRKKNPSSGK